MDKHFIAPWHTMSSFSHFHFLGYKFTEGLGVKVEEYTWYHRFLEMVHGPCMSWTRSSTTQMLIGTYHWGYTDLLAEVWTSCSGEPCSLAATNDRTLGGNSAPRSGLFVVTAEEWRYDRPLRRKKCRRKMKEKIQKKRLGISLRGAFYSFCWTSVFLNLFL